MTDHRWLPELIQRFRSKRILVIGDLMLDEFVWGRVSRISPEAPVPIVEVTNESYYPGGAANVARNLREFTAQVAVMGIVGHDGPAEHLKAILTEEGIDISGIQQSARYHTIVKTRIIARQQHIVRVDRESLAVAEPASHARALEHIEARLPELDGVIVEDYGKGFLTQPFVDEMGRMIRDAGKILTIDPNPRNNLRWTGATAIKPNRAEAFHAAGLPSSESGMPPASDGPLLEACKVLLERWDTEMLLVTLGEQGMLLVRDGRTPYPLPPRPREVFDVSGAGDTAIALFTLALTAGSPAEEAAEVANHAASIVVGKLGTAVVDPAELLASFTSDPQ